MPADNPAPRQQHTATRTLTPVIDFAFHKQTRNLDARLQATLATLRP
jgi:hypothetical protein